jgi:hypothetical protein
MLNLTRMSLEVRGGAYRGILSERTSLRSRRRRTAGDLLQQIQYKSLLRGEDNTP